MKRLLIGLAIASLTTILATMFSGSPSSAAGGNFLYWSAPTVKTGSVATCYSFAHDAMRQLNFQNIRRSANEVAGTNGSTYAAITCIPTAPNVTAIVMATGSDSNATAKARDNLRIKIAGIIRFD